MGFRFFILFIQGVEKQFVCKDEKGLDGILNFPNCPSHLAVPANNWKVRTFIDSSLTD